MSELDIEKVFEKWFINKEKELWNISRVKNIQHLVDMINEFGSQDTFSKFRTQRESYTSGFKQGEEHGAKQGRVNALEEAIRAMDNGEVIYRFIDSELKKLRKS